MKRIVNQVLAVIVIFGLSFAASAKVDPKVHLEQVTQQISAEILENKDKIKADAEYAKGLIETYLLPEVDTEYMAKRILGREYWTESTEAQRQTFIEQFISLLLNSYAKGLANYDGQPITYEDTQYSTSGNTANVRSVIIPQEGEPILIDYRLKLGADDKWLVTDVIIEGVSMAKSYATQYRERIAQIGIEATLQELAEENKKAKNASEISDENPNEKT
ncbi:MlaC/ttg2D family ABC transporter substrate-binding protein [Kangiella koreensis]|uniref:Toluene tolerance family protein n=1 Tax=Kangiella koreensis (strain DSM 16069 / JCM 12317 / KCTC 12182 / SW-125) TaxID=523791 RepID=C7RCK0_KANKD|nr:ABC transporter substrate-binding protein [Kangiella koreensis]ACV26992.1 toluene tolerance family protein [Kangiella koreensis DSM 16069]